MTKQDIVFHIASKTGIPSVEVLATVEAFLTTVKGFVSKGERLEIRGFGSFNIVKRKQKTARNINQGTEIIIPAHNVIKFKPSKFFKLQSHDEDQ